MATFVTRANLKMGGFRLISSKSSVEHQRLQEDELKHNERNERKD
jgi:hypothetical protein